MNSRKVEFRFTNLQRKLSSPSHANSVIVEIDTKSEEIFVNQTTDHQTRRSTPATLSCLDTINLSSSSHDHIRSLLRTRFASYHWLCDDLFSYSLLKLASEISTAAIDLGFGRNGFTITVIVTVTYRSVWVTSNNKKSLRIVLLGRIKAEELKSLKMETESCSICLENLVSGPKPSDLTRMTCSHVFHNPCLLEWFKRKNTCPLCRTELYDR
ncbi:putative transcription factor C2H2 family [Arabidopsis thaliana]